MISMSLLFLVLIAAQAMAVSGTKSTAAEEHILKAAGVLSKRLRRESAFLAREEGSGAIASSDGPLVFSSACMSFESPTAQPTMAYVDDDASNDGGGDGGDDDEDGGAIAGAVIGSLALVGVIYCSWSYYQTHYAPEPSMQRMGLMNSAGSDIY
jgi:hypothetical protein